MFRRLYRQLLDAAGGRHAMPTLAGVSFAEASFFPLPPDLMLGPMVVAKPERWVSAAALCTVASVLGGLFGYAIGFFLLEAVGRPLMAAFGHPDGVGEFQAAFAQWGAWIILIKGLTPIPFKLVTIASGAAHFSLPIFIACAIVTRGARFFLVAWLFKKWGPQMAPVIERRLGLVMLGVAALIVVGLLAAAMI